MTPTLFLNDTFRFFDEISIKSFVIDSIGVTAFAWITSKMLHHPSAVPVIVFFNTLHLVSKVVFFLFAKLMQRFPLFPELHLAGRVVQIISSVYLSRKICDLGSIKFATKEIVLMATGFICTFISFKWIVKFVQEYYFRRNRTIHTE